MEPPKIVTRLFRVTSTPAFWPRKLLLSCDDVSPLVVTVTFDKRRLPPLRT
jgi:hypothetical protein